MLRIVSTALLTGLLAAGAFASDTELTAMRHSCGYHCNPDGSDATPSAPSTGPETLFVGRTNQHSGGRAGGKAQPRTGSGADHRSMGWVSSDSDAQIQFVGRTNVHSGGREGGAANKRVGHPGGPSHPNSFTIEVPDAHMLAVDGFGRNRGTRPHHPRATCRCN